MAKQSQKRNLEREVEQLRARVASLAAAQEEALRDAPEPRPNESTDGGLDVKFEELFKTVKEELDEASGVTVLTVFALGPLVGRSLAF